MGQRMTGPDWGVYVLSCFLISWNREAPWLCYEWVCVTAGMACEPERISIVTKGWPAFVMGFQSVLGRRKLLQRDRDAFVSRTPPLN